MVQDGGISQVGQEAKKPHHLTGRLQPGFTQDLMPGGQCSWASVLSDDGEGLFSAQNPGPFNKVKASSCVFLPS